MKLKKEWNDVEKTTKELLKLFNIWRISNLRITRGRCNTLEDTFGFPYTSSSDYAAIWNCQAEAVYKWDTEWRFEALAVSENNEAIVVFEHEDGTVENRVAYEVSVSKIELVEEDNKDAD